MRSSIALITAFSFAALGAGCMTQDHDATGTLEMPLVDHGPDGALYHLSGAFEITNPDGTVQFADAGANDPSITVKVPAGITSVQLLDGWDLQKSIDNGATYQPVSALLGSLNPATVRVLANQPASVQFDFLVRDRNGTLTISIGVATHPRELAGGAIIDTGTGDYAPYQTPATKRFDFGVFYTLGQVENATLADGTREHVYTAGAVALEVYNDGVGVLANTVAPTFAGGYLAYHVAAKPDGTQEVTGTLQSSDGQTVIDFGPHALDPVLPLDADGFPVDQFFYDPFVPFTATTNGATGTSTLAGTLRLRFIP
jgi:hypothetical protein